MDSCYKQFRLSYDVIRNLRRTTPNEIHEMLSDERFETDFLRVKHKIDSLNIPDGTGGVNPGDRRAIYHLVRFLKPKSILEIGTHIGASVIHFAAAISDLHEMNGARVDTVDLKDVNSEGSRPWVACGSKVSPRAMLKRLHLDSFVHFHTAESCDFLSSTKFRYDLIFLDGSHTKTAVKREVPLALRALATGGAILLHDYFPNGEPIWDGVNVIRGPYDAIEALREEGWRIDVIPLGRLPWLTKLNTNLTSLALVTRSSEPQP